MPKTPQELGYEWEHELARLVGGRVQKGSGNLIIARGDVAGRAALLWSAKFSTHLSSPVTKVAIEDAKTMASGPEVGIAHDVVFGYKLGDGTMRADLDLLQLIEWLREPPSIIPATKQDAIRATARRPTMLRDE